MKEVVYPTIYFTRNTIPAKFMDQMYVAFLELDRMMERPTEQQLANI